jgi:hypothetical protein
MAYGKVHVRSNSHMSGYTKPRGIPAQEIVEEKCLLDIF